MAPEAVPDNDVPSAESSRPWWKSPHAACRAASSWIGAHRRQAALTTVLLLVPLLGLLAYRLIRPDSGLGPPTLLEEVLAALDRGQYAETQALARRLRTQEGLAPEEQGGPLFALGAATLHEALASMPRQRGQLLLIASRYLEEAMQRGFPPGRKGEGLFLYGKCLYEMGQVRACRPVLTAALKAERAPQSAIRLLLAASYLNDAKPRLSEALEQNTLYLSDKKLSTLQREEGLLQRGEILLQMNRVSECYAALAQVSGKSRLRTEAAFLRAQALMHEGRVLRRAKTSEKTVPAAAREKYQAAIGILRQVQGYDAARPAAVRRAMYLVGLCFEAVGDDQAALAQFTRISGLYSGTPEGTAASFRSAELLFRLGRPGETLAAYRQTLNAYRQTSRVRNPWLTPRQLYAQLWKTYQQYLGRREFQRAEPYLALIEPLVSPERLLHMRAEFHADWAQALMRRAESASPGKREFRQIAARKQYRRAGASYTELARQFPAAPEYTDRIWDGAVAYFEGRDYRRAAKLFQVYLQNEVRNRRPQALAYLGESQLALGRVAAALETLKECIADYPRDVAACRARLLAACVCQEKGQFAEARRLLTENLQGDYLTPASKEWRGSLLTLGELLADEGRYEEAARRLEEFIGRYPDLPDNLLARYLLAETLRHSALAAEEAMKKDRARTSWGVQAERIRLLLAEALRQYRTVEEKLAAEPNAAELSARDQALLRNCSFAVGDVLYMQGQYEAAIQAYFDAAQRYDKQPESLAAYEQISRAYRRLNKPGEARSAIRQAQIALSRMNSDAPFESTSLFTRKQWKERLQRLSVL
ncbi:MAG: tetratricopeptide repeat protein [Pirellulales bacterium]|nr:tetratricopeptide repeat protein [Pirellulales bacterium]